MKVSGESGAKPPTEGATPAAKGAKSERSAKSDKPSKSFDSVLAKKREFEPQDSVQAEAAAMQPPAFLPRGDPAPVQAAAGAAPAPAPIEGLVKEIVSVAAPDGSHWVDIQFDSKTLQGLHVRVAHDAEGVSIRLQTASDDVGRLLARNVDRLQQALEAKGVPVPAIHIETGPAPAATFQDGRPDSGSQGRDRGQGGGGGGQGRQERQNRQ